jgi:hypothetical protein
LLHGSKAVACITEDTSVRQYSLGPAATGAVILAKASANKAAAGVAVSFRSWIIFLPSMLAQPLDDRHVILARRGPSHVCDSSRPAKSEFGFMGGLPVKGLKVALLPRPAKIHQAK